MENLLLDVWKLIAEHWGMIFLITLPYLKDFLVSAKDFAKELKSITKDTHTILKSHEDRICTLEKKLK